MELALAIAAAAVAALVLVLRRVAPLTKTTKDDKLLELAEPASEVLDKVAKK